MEVHSIDVFYNAGDELPAVTHTLNEREYGAPYVVLHIDGIALFVERPEVLARIVISASNARAELAATLRTVAIGAAVEREHDDHEWHDDRESSLGCRWCWPTLTDVERAEQLQAQRADSGVAY